MAMDDATLVRNTKLRLARSKSLKDWTMETVLSNLDAYTQEKGATYLKTKLSPQLRDEVLQKLLRTRRPAKIKSIEEFNRMKWLVFVLMNSRTFNLNLDALMSFYPRNLNIRDSILDFIEVLKEVSIAAPNVRHLQIHSGHITRCLMKRFEFRNDCLEYLSSLKELRILELNDVFYNPMDLVELCRQLPNLQVLSAPGAYFERTNMSEEDIRLSFGHLRLLNINISSCEKLTNKNWKVVPNIIHRYCLPEGLTFEYFVEDENIPRERKYLKIDEHRSESNVCEDFSSIRYLEFDCYGRRWNDFKKNLKLPTTLDGLSLFWLHCEETVDAILRRFGANLRLLSLNGGGFESVNLNRISELCPKLEVLSMSLLKVTGNSTQQINFNHLKELITERVYMMNGSLTAVLSSSPNLRRLNLFLWSYCLDDVRQVKNLVIEKKILGSLQSVVLNIPKMTSGCGFNEFASIVKNASATLPHLKILKMFYKNSRLNNNTYQHFLNNIGLHEPINCYVKLFEILNLYE